LCLIVISEVVAGQDFHATTAEQPEWIAEKVAAADTAGHQVLEGRDGWLYPVSELRALSVGRFWGERAAEVSRAAKPENADPLAAIVDFHNQLKRAEIRLILVPVPGKAVIYPEPLATEGEKLEWKASSDVDSERLDCWHSEFYGVLRARGIEVIDLVPEFRRQRFAEGGPLYCRTDSHWTPRGALLAAEKVSAMVAASNWAKGSPRADYQTRLGTVQITGDLAVLMGKERGASETISVESVASVRGVRSGTTAAALVDRSSPVLMIGDSHTLVFHDPQMFAAGSGFPDFVAKQLGMPVDLIGVRGSGATTTRIEILRRRDQLAGKKVLIWCLSFREFTESEAGWRKVPVIPVR
jgi:alginate O-acetyltransferase complex protein AlgJ